MVIALGLFSVDISFIGILVAPSSELFMKYEGLSKKGKHLHVVTSILNDSETCHLAAAFRDHLP